ncbi:hypothetical protein [Pseudoxanthomonas beigongshangi]|uniref:hypothetical protein n=1 Tax=Pseudoxanthomonas beigongshangi TaxID=2782537 RepID=UPI00193BF56A|nr:hypothetical protein [Pseudoxanthomonas beigongshangi]
MNGTMEIPRSKGFWLVAVLALIWNLIGVAMFWMQVNMSAEALAAMTERQRQVYEATPMWLNVAFAIAVFGGVLGAIGMLMGKRWAVTMFFVSLLALLVQMIGAYLVTPAWDAYGVAGLVMPAVLIVIALLFWRYAQRCVVRGWLV